jgi:hypothetical protein
VVEEGERCRASEHALRWPRRGGLRALDAERRELGAFLEVPRSNTTGETMRVIDDASGLRFGVRLDNGQLGDDRYAVPVEISFTGPQCTSTAFRWNESIAGLVFPFEGFLGVGIRIEALPQRSKFVNGACIPGSVFVDRPVLSTVVEAFSGVVPFSLPVPTPLLVGPGN